MSAAVWLLLLSGGRGTDCLAEGWLLAILTLPMTEGCQLYDMLASPMCVAAKLEALEIGLLTGQNGQRLCNSPAFKYFLRALLCVTSSTYLLLVLRPTGGRPVKTTALYFLQNWGLKRQSLPTKKMGSDEAIPCPACFSLLPMSHFSD
jgi:hypothetical protein